MLQEDLFLMTVREAFDSYMLAVYPQQVIFTPFDAAVAIGNFCGLTLESTIAQMRLPSVTGPVNRFTILQHCERILLEAERTCLSLTPTPAFPLTPPPPPPPPLPYHHHFHNHHSHHRIQRNPRHTQHRHQPQQRQPPPQLFVAAAATIQLDSLHTPAPEVAAQVSVAPARPPVRLVPLVEGLVPERRWGRRVTAATTEAAPRSNPPSPPPPPTNSATVTHSTLLTPSPCARSLTRTPASLALWCTGAADAATTRSASRATVNDVWYRSVAAAGSGAAGAERSPSPKRPTRSAATPPAMSAAAAHTGVATAASAKGPTAPTTATMTPMMATVTPKNQKSDLELWYGSALTTPSTARGSGVKICKQFARTGHCRFGSRCLYHHVSDGGASSGGVTAITGRTPASNSTPLTGKSMPSVVDLNWAGTAEARTPRSVLRCMTATPEEIYAEMQPAVATREKKEPHHSPLGPRPVRREEALVPPARHFAHCDDAGVPGVALGIMGRVTPVLDASEPTAPMHEAVAAAAAAWKENAPPAPTQRLQLQQQLEVRVGTAPTAEREGRGRLESRRPAGLSVASVNKKTSQVGDGGR